MTLQRLITISLCLLPCAALHAAELPDSLGVTQSLAQAGAVRLALQRVETLQPPPGAPHWGDWERLRLQLLGSAGLHEQLLQRITALPPGADARLAADLRATAAQAALGLGRGAAARDLAQRALWAPGVAAVRVRELRLLVIRSLLLDRQAEDAYRSMLRFQQDYAPLDVATATDFVDGLLDVGLVKEAVNWLGLLDERGATKLRLRLQTGLVKPSDAVNLARVAITGSDFPGWRRVLLEAAERQQNAALRIEALEQLLNVAPEAVHDARTLWQAYAAYARGAANAHQLLVGDDAQWLEFAQRRLEAEAPVARAYFAYLARAAGAEAIRTAAQTQLVASLAASRLQRAALRLFGVWPDAPALPALDARYLLGALAEDAGDEDRALRYRQGLPAPQGIPPAVWELRLAATALRAGRTDVANTVLKALLTSATAPPAPQVPEWLALATQLAAHGQADSARAVFGHLLPHADAVQTRAALIGLARSHEALNQPLLAAEHYLRAALRTPDGEAAAQARLLAGFNLVRAGLREDARAQFEWLVKYARDPAQQAAARRELGLR